MYDDAGSLRGIGRSQGKSAPRRRASSLRPHSQRSAKTHDDDGREPFNHEPTKAHCAATAFTKQDDEPTRLTATGCASSPGQQQRGPWADGQTTHDKTIPAERPIDQLSQEEAQEGGSRFGLQKSGSAADNTEQDMWSIFRPITTRTTTPITSTGGSMTRLRRPRRWRKGMEVRMEFCPAPGRRGSGGPFRVEFSFVFLFFCLAELGGRRSDCPALTTESCVSVRGIGFGESSKGGKPQQLP